MRQKMSRALLAASCAAACAIGLSSPVLAQSRTPSPELAALEGEASLSFPVKYDNAGRLLIDVQTSSGHSLEMMLSSLFREARFPSATLAEMEAERHPKATGVVYGMGYDRYIRTSLYEIPDLTALGQIIDYDFEPEVPSITGLSADGIIGLEFLTGFVVRLSRSDDMLHVYKDARAIDALGWEVYQGHPVGYGSLGLDMMIDGVRVPMLLELGLSNTTINWTAAKMIAEQKKGYVLTPEELEKTSGALNVRSGHGMHRTHGIRLNSPLLVTDTPWDVPVVAVANLPLATELALNKEKPSGFMGVDVLQGRDFAIDMRTWRLFLGPKAARQTAQAN